MRALCIDLSSVKVISTPSEWDLHAEDLIGDLEAKKILGLDCEWVTRQSRRPVALLQLATTSGRVFLVRLFQFKTIPTTLKTILGDKNILKVGVAIEEDANKLFNDYRLSVSGWVDLRYVALRTRLLDSLQGLGLRNLSKAVLDVDLKKSSTTARSNWEASSLSSEQILYAAADALVGVFIFVQLIANKLERRGGLQSEYTVKAVCQGIIEQRVAKTPKSKEKSSGARNKNVDEETDQTTHVIGRGFVARKKPLYQNCQLLAPDNQLLCTCDDKKAHWYIDKGLAEHISDDPLTVRLLFEPSGRPTNDKNYYTQDKLNICVVCGAEASYIRKNIIPHEYRKHFPPVMKEHRSHDVLLVCLPCHTCGNINDSKLKGELAVKCCAPIGTQNGIRFQKDFQLSQVVSAAKALTNANAKIPEARKEELRNIIKDYYGICYLEHCLIEEALTLDWKVENAGFTPHGEKVVQHFIEHGGLVEFEKMWRMHFVDTMSPQYLPDMWSVEHHHQELEDLNNDLQTSITNDNRL